MVIDIDQQVENSVLTVCIHSKPITWLTFTSTIACNIWLTVNLDWCVIPAFIPLDIYLESLDDAQKEIENE